MTEFVTCLYGKWLLKNSYNTVKENNCWLHDTPDGNICSTANLHLSLLFLPALFFTDNSGHDNDTESVSELTSGCSSPLMFKCVHVSTVSHHANYTFIPFLLEWFIHTGCRFFFFFRSMMSFGQDWDFNAACINFVFIFIFRFDIFSALFSGEADKMNNKPWPGRRILPA